MSPTTNGIVSAGYADTLSSAVGTGMSAHSATLTFTAGLTYAISETLTAAPSYSMTRQKGGPAGSVLVDLVLITLRKSF